MSKGALLVTVLLVATMLMPAALAKPERGGGPPPHHETRDVEFTGPDILGWANGTAYSESQKSIHLRRNACPECDPPLPLAWLTFSGVFITAKDGKYYGEHPFYDMEIRLDKKTNEALAAFWWTQHDAQHDDEKYKLVGEGTYEVTGGAYDVEVWGEITYKVGRGNKPSNRMLEWNGTVVFTMTILTP